RKRSQAGVDPAPDVWLLFKDLAQHRVDDRQFVLQPVLKLGHDQLAVFLLLDQRLGDLALLAGDGAIVLEAPDRQSADQPENQEQRDAGEIGRAGPEIEENAESA